MVDETETLSGSLDDIRALCAVVEFGTISAAARLLGETKGSVSRRLSRLEARLGTALLARTPRAVSPTEEGLAFYAKATEALTWLDDAAESVRQSRSVPSGRLRITAPADLGANVLPELIVRFRQMHPQIAVELLSTDTVLDLATHRVDLALRVPAGALPDMSYRASLMASFKVRLYAAPAYLAVHRPPQSPAALAGHALISVQGFSGAVRPLLYNSRGRVEQIVARPAIRTTDYVSAFHLSLAGGGIAPLSELVARRSVAAEALVPVLPEWHLADVKLHAVSVGGRDAPARVRVFKDFLRSALRTAACDV